MNKSVAAGTASKQGLAQRKHYSLRSEQDSDPIFELWEEAEVSFEREKGRTF